MKIIKCLSEKIQEELEDAGTYIDLALEWKEKEPETAELFYQLSTEEMGHADRLHKRVAEQISEYRAENGDPPEGMMVLYNYLHERQTAEAMKIRIKQSMYKA